MKKQSFTDIAHMQQQWVKQLETVALAPIMVSQHQTDGRTPSIRYFVREHDWRFPYQYRRCMDNELFFDIDENSWFLVMIYVKPLIRILKKKKIPFIMAGSGGRGVHINSWFNAIDYQKQFGFRQVREALWNWVLDEAGIDIGLRGVGKPYCNAVICFSDQLEYGRVLREFGGAKNNNRKTVIKKLPSNREDVYKTPTQFPDKIEVWDVPIGILESLDLKARHKKKPLWCGICPVDRDWVYENSHYEDEWGDLRVKRNCCTACLGLMENGRR